MRDNVIEKKIDLILNALEIPVFQEGLIYSLKGMFPECVFETKSEPYFLRLCSGLGWSADYCFEVVYSDGTRKRIMNEGDIVNGNL